MSFRSNAAKIFLSAIAIVGGRDAATLTGATTLSGSAGTVQSLDPGGSTRTVDLPGRTEGIADTNGRLFVIQNTADAAGENLTVRDPADATVGTLTKGQTGVFWGTGGQGYTLVGTMGGSLGSTATGEGAALIGIEDAGAYITGTTVEAAIAELATGAGVFRDQLVTATIAVANAPGGATTAALTLQLRRASDHSTNIASARQVLITGHLGGAGFAYAPFRPDVLAACTFGTATTGSIIASDDGWALVQTDATGAFACTATNTNDELVNFAAESARGVSDLTKRCTVVGSNADAATWSA